MEKKASSLMHSFGDSKSGFDMGKVLIILVIVAVLGIATGYMLGKNKSSSSIVGLIPGNSANGSSAEVGKTYGSNDTSTYKDTAEGVLNDGGIDGEGQFHLVRPGGDSQNVYLTSSTVDLSTFLNRKIKVWGQTQAAQKAGWLMDVGRVQVLN